MTPSNPTFPILLTGLILAVTLGSLVIIFGSIIWWLRREKRAITRRWEQEGLVFLRGPVGVNFSGLESKGSGQIRGNGFMALTGQDLRVVRAVPPAEWGIAHNQIKQVVLESSFLGKRRGMKVLVITFEQAGQLDRLGLYVGDNTAWVKAIASAAGLDQ